MKFIKTTYHLIILLCLGIAPAWSQADSILNVARTSQNDSTKFKSYSRAFWEVVYSDREKSLAICNEMKNQIDDNTNARYKGNYFNLRGTYQNFYGETDSALYYYKEYFKCGQSINDSSAMAYALNNIGATFYNTGELDSATYWFKMGLSYRPASNHEERAQSLYNVGLCQIEKGLFELGMKNYYKAIKILEKTPNVETDLANLYINIGSAYANRDENEKALYFYLKSDSLYKKVNHKDGRITLLNNIGAMLINEKKLIEAETYLEKALKLANELKRTVGLVETQRQWAELYYHQGKWMKSLKVINDVIDLAHNNYRELVNLLKIKGQVYNKIGSSDKAIDAFQKGLQIAKENKYLDVMVSCHRGLYLAYKQKNNFDLALSNYQVFIHLEDSLQKSKNAREVLRQEYQYEYEKKAAADSIKVAEKQNLKDLELEQQKALSKKQELEAQKQRQQSYFLWGGLSLVIIFSLFLFSRFKVTNKQKNIIHQQKQKVDEAYELLDEKNTEILDSISYAKRIQSAILPPSKEIQKHLPNSFVFYQPKDIVAGDFYWLESTPNLTLIAAADCTGHGVPGAMVSVVCNNALNRSVREFGLTDPGKILNQTRDIVIQEFEKSEQEVKDGMDIALVALQNEKQNENEDPHSPYSFSLCYSGAHNPLWIIRNGANEVEEIKANKQPIGKFDRPTNFVSHQVELQKGDTIYIFSDGFADQFGGENGKKFKSKNFKRLLVSIQNLSMEEQRQKIKEEFENWRGELEQLDDVCVIGIKI